MRGKPPLTGVQKFGRVTSHLRFAALFSVKMALSPPQLFISKTSSECRASGDRHRKNRASSPFGCSATDSSGCIRAFLDQRMHCRRGTLQRTSSRIVPTRVFTQLTRGFGVKTSINGTVALMRKSPPQNKIPHLCSGSTRAVYGIVLYATSREVPMDASSIAETRISVVIGASVVCVIPGVPFAFIRERRSEPSRNRVQTSIGTGVFFGET